MKTISKYMPLETKNISCPVEKRVCLLSSIVSVLVVTATVIVILAAVIIVIITCNVCYLLCSVSRAAITLPINCGRIFAISVREPMHVIKLTLLTCGEP